MKKKSPLPPASPLFAGVAEADLGALLRCLAAVKKRFPKGGFIWAEGNRAGLVGLTLSGAVHVLREDFWGGRLILGRVEPGGLFGESFACAGSGRLPVSVQAAEESEVLFLDCRKILAPCASACAFHARVVRNLARILAEKNILLTRKLEHITRPTTREKLLSYLSEEARRAGGDSFDIPFTRQELADYLAVDRSALSGVLSKMRADKLLRCRRGHFELLTGAGTCKKPEAEDSRIG
ncbi:Crp/Fnr family transcriptional regulator [Deltaproteobacteria bacterium]|nr:Crp/Fnr family transcriptional regulator [Deltaproteobacteria bacterium]